VVKEYHDENKLFVGHFIVTQSKNYEGTVDAKTLKQYRYVILGHGHNHEMSRDNWCQLGSIRYVDFGEDQNIKKVVAVCQNYESSNPRWIWIPLKTPYPMINIELGQNDKIDPTQMASNPKSSICQAQDSLKTRQFKALSEVLTYLDQLDPKTKVRIIFSDYSLWREFLPLSETYKNKFFKFVEKKDFIMSSNLVISKTENITLKESLLKFLETNKVPEEIKKILLEEIR
jgi:DNA repair exonuclease SbcCD nuclease subunit